MGSAQFSRWVVSNSLWPDGLQHIRLPCPSPTSGAYSNSCASCQWCHPTISSSVIPFSSHLQSFPVSGSFPMSQFFASGGQRIGASASASVLPINTQDWFPLELTGWISLQSKGSHSLLQRIFPSQGLNLGLLHCRQILYHLSHQGDNWRKRKRKKISSSAMAFRNYGYFSLFIWPKLLNLHHWKQ